MILIYIKYENQIEGVLNVATDKDIKLNDKTTWL